MTNAEPSASKAMPLDQRLARLANRATAWEIALVGIDGAARLVGYSERHTKAVIGDNFDRRRAAILPLIDETSAEWNKARMAYVAPTWRIGFSGPTERQAIQEGELPRLATVATPPGRPAKPDVTLS